MSKYLFIIFAFIAISCQNNNYTDKLSELEICGNNIDFSISKIEKYNSTNFYDIYVVMNENINKYNSTIDDSTQLNLIIKDIGKYADLSKFFKKASPRYEALYKELFLSKNQIANLKLDLKNNSITSEQAEKYYKEEISIANMLIKESDQMILEATNNIALYDSLNIVISTLIKNKE